MRRVFAFAIVAFLVWALVPGLAEVFENAVHFAREGHSAHADPDGDRHDASDSEHPCNGVSHLCQCCVSLSFLPASPIVAAEGRVATRFVASSVTPPAAIRADGIDHPPRA